MPFSRSLPRPRHVDPFLPPALGYAMAVGLVLAAAAIEILTGVSVTPLLFFYPAVLAAAWWCGPGPGALSIVLACLGVVYLLVPPLRSFALADPRHSIDVALFAAVGAVLVTVAARLRRALIVTEAASRSARRESALLSSIIDHVPIGLAFATTDGDVRLVNPELLRMKAPGTSPLTPAHVGSDTGLRWAEARPVTPGEWKALLAGAEADVVHFEAEARSTDGSWTPVSCCLAPVRDDASGPVIGTVGIVRDMSSERAIADLQEELVAVIAHDLRSPIGAIVLSLEAAMRDPVEDGRVRVSAQSVARMHRSAERLHTMVDELLDASRVQLGAVPLDRQPEDLGATAREVAEELRPGLGDHALAVHAPARPLMVAVDRLRFAQILGNLLDNAAKYSPDGTPIDVRIDAQGGGAHLAVTDRGFGIAADDVPKLFDRFFQTKRARARKSGLGLGLYITKGLVEAHGGRLWVDSVVDRGSTFHVWLPEARPAEEQVVAH